MFVQEVSLPSNFLLRVQQSNHRSTGALGLKQNRIGWVAIIYSCDSNSVEHSKPGCENSCCPILKYVKTYMLMHSTGYCTRLGSNHLNIILLSYSMLFRNLISI